MRDECPALLSGNARQAIFLTNINKKTNYHAFLRHYAFVCGFFILAYYRLLSLIFRASRYRTDNEIQ